MNNFCFLISEFDETWFETPLIQKNDLGFSKTLATDDIIIWCCFGIEIRTWITLDLVVQF